MDVWWGAVDNSGDNFVTLGKDPFLWAQVPLNYTTMFLGEFSHALDDKFRLAIPVKFRAKLADGAVVTRGLDRCLFLYPRKEWTELATKLASLPLSQANARAFSRMMLAGAADVELDRQGRAVLPEYLRKYAGIEKRVTVAGLFNRVELWDEASWQTYKAKTEKDTDTIAAKMTELGV